MQIRSSSLRRRAALGLSIGLTALAIAVSPAAAPRAVSAQSSAAQNDPAWDFGRGGAEVPGQPACYMPSPGEPTRKMYSLMRPSCFPSHLF
jgi:hypothetical protein